MIRLRPSGADEVLIKRVRDWYEPGPGVFIASTAGQTASFTPALLFTGSTTGAWYDPSDTTTLFQDAAGTLPVTAVEQPVGRMLDKSGRGNHAFNSSGNSANFPVLSARYNLLTKSEQFDDAVWAKSGTASVMSNSTIAPNGTQTADTINLPNATSDYVYYPITVQASSYKAGVYLKGAAGETAYVYLGAGIPSGQSPLLTFTFNGEWQWLSADKVLAAGTQYFYFYRKHQNGGADATATSFYAWGADLRVANDALNQPAYQRVNTASDYDTVGFKRAEVFDGINDYLLASAGGGSTTAFFWCSAIRVGKVGAAQTLFSDAGTNTGYVVRVNASNQLELSAGNGTAYTTIATTATLAVGQRVVLTAWHDGTNLNVQINNGTVQQAAFVTATAGTAQFTIGKDNNAATNFFSGRLYEKVYTKDNVPSAAQIASTKSYVANIAGITL